MNAEFVAHMADYLTRAAAPSAPIPEPFAQPSTSTPILLTAASYYFTPIPPQLESKFDKATLLLESISRQLSELQASQQEGFQELTFRHDTHDVNVCAAMKEAGSSFLLHMRTLINEVSHCFARGGPNMPSVQAQTKYEDKLYKEVRDAEDAATKAAKGERMIKALNIRLLHEINDLRRQLNLSQYMEVPKERETFNKGQAEFEIEQRMKKAAAKEEERYHKEQERINNMRNTSVIEDSDDEM